MDILISGAGIAGPTLALLLARDGHDVTVVERAATTRTGGQAVDVRGAARTVVERIGLMDAIRRRALDQEGMAYVDRRGRTLAAMPADDFGGEGLISEIELLRDDLVDIVRSACPDSVRYVFGDSIASIAQDADGVDVTFERGARGRFDLVVGADGLHSRVRELAFGPHEHFIRPIGLHMAWFSISVDLPLGGWFQMHCAGRGLAASARHGGEPGWSKVLLSVNGTLDYERGDREGQQAALRRAFAAVDWLVPEMLEAMPGSPDFTMSAMGQVVMPRLSTGRVVLLGDAGYCPTPLTGLGTTTGIVGAYVLAGELARAAADHRTALERYETVMRPYIELTQTLPPGGANSFAPRSRLMLALLPLSIWATARGPLRRIIAAQAAKAGNIDLPRYERVDS